MPHRFVQPARTLVTVTVAAALLGACASKPPQMIGAVTPLANGEVQSSVKANDKTTALKAFDHDATIHCTRRGAIRALDSGGKYVVLSQDVKEKSNAIGSTGDSRLDVAAQLGARLKGLERKDEVEIVTMFKCEG